MKVFCYDLLLAELWSKKPFSPGFLVHDSTIFAGVDERQHANALILAARKSAECGFQYICTMNTDSVPVHELGNDLALSPFVRITLTDQTHAIEWHSYNISRVSYEAAEKVGLRVAPVKAPNVTRGVDALKLERGLG